MNDKINDLIKKLKVNTESGKIEWQKTSRSGEFMVSLGNGAVSADRWEDSEGEYVDFRILNINGDEIGTWIFSKEETDGYKKLLNLHNAIKSKYLKIDETLDGLLDELE